MTPKKTYRKAADYEAGARHSFETRKEMDNFRQSFFKFIKRRGFVRRGLFFNDPVGGYRVAIINPADVAGSQEALREYAALGNNFTTEIDGIFYENHRAAAAILGVSTDRLYDTMKNPKRHEIGVMGILAEKAERVRRVKRETEAKAAPRYMFDGLPFNSLPEAWAHFGMGRGKFKAAINDPRYPAMGVLGASAARDADLGRKYTDKAAGYEKPIEIDGVLFKSQKEAMGHFGLTPHVFRRIVRSRRFFEIGMAACLAEEADVMAAAEAKRAAEVERLAQWRAAQIGKPSKAELAAQEAARKKAIAAAKAAKAKAIADEKAAKEKAIADAKAAKEQAKADAEAASIAAAERMAQAIADRAARKQAKADAERARAEQAQREADQIAQARAARADRLKCDAEAKAAQRAADEAARVSALRKIEVK